MIIKDNLIDNGETGIKLLSNVNNTKIEHNVIIRNTQGIWLHEASHNLIFNNNITDQFYGIRVDVNSSHNVIYNNYFARNNIHAFDPKSNNSWNITLTNGTNIIGGPKIGGNYWDDYTGEDINGDSIGETNIPYNSSGNIKHGGDYLPLVPYDNIPPTVEVLYPNGGEVLTGNITIRWNAYDNSNYELIIDLYYSDNAGVTWNVISENENNDGEFNWDITNLPEGSEYLVKVNARDLAGNENNDTSDETFSITKKTYPGPKIKIIDPGKGWLYFFDKKIVRLFPNFRIIIGQITINTEVTSVVGIEKVEFYIDSDLAATDIEPTNETIYSWTWDERVIFYHTTTIKAYDLYGQSSTESFGALIFNLNLI